MSSLVQKMIGAAKLDPATYEGVEADPNATTQAMTVVIISALAAGIGNIRAGLLAMIMVIVVALVGWLIWAFLCYIIGAKILPEEQTDADLGQLLRTTGFAQSPGVLRALGIIPGFAIISSVIAGIWMLVATVVAVRQALDYKSTGRAVGVVVIGFVVNFVFSIMVGLMVAVGGGIASGLAG